MIKANDMFWDTVFQNDCQMFWATDDTCIDITVKIVLWHQTN
jgi:hypothetical protein